MSIWNFIKGGWKTHGPNQIIGDAGFASDEDPLYRAVSAECALRLSAVLACVERRAEAIGSLPIHLRDDKKKILKDHPLYAVLHESPNSMQTAPEFWSMQTAHVDLYGNGISVVTRRNDKSVISIEPTSRPDLCTMQTKGKTGRYIYNIDGDEYPADDVLHLKGFSLNGLWGLPRLDLGKEILSSQITANHAAMRAFQQGTKIGGFFEVERDLDEQQEIDFQERLKRFARPENFGRWMRLLKGMKPIAGDQFRMKASDVELLASRYFGLEEVCRLFNVPPQLIGHSDKASSWASSLEQINLFFLMYSLQPTFVRDERRINKTLLTANDRARGYQPKFSIQGLLRADSKTQSAMFASGLQNGYYNRDEVRDLLDRGAIEGGDKYTVQLNMTPVTDMPDNQDSGDGKNPKKGMTP